MPHRRNGAANAGLPYGRYAASSEPVTVSITVRQQWIKFATANSSVVLSKARFTAP